jgi:hypothetical protein
MNNKGSGDPVKGNSELLYEVLSLSGYVNSSYDEFSKYLENPDIAKGIYKHLVKNHGLRETWAEWAPVWTVPPSTDTESVQIDPTDDAPEVNEEFETLGNADAAPEVAGTESNGENASSELSENPLQTVDGTPLFDLSDQIEIQNEISALRAEQEKLGLFDPRSLELQEEIDSKSNLLNQTKEGNKTKVFDKRDQIEKKYSELQRRRELSIGELSKDPNISMQDVLRNREQQKQAIDELRRNEIAANFTDDEIAEFNAIDQIIKDTNNYSTVKLPGASEPDGVGRMFGEAFGIYNPQNYEETEKLNLLPEVRAEIANAVDTYSLQKAAEGRMPLLEKNKIVKEARLNVLERKIKEVDSEFSTKIKQDAAKYKQLEKELFSIKEIAEGAKDQETFDKYSSAFDAKKQELDALAETLGGYEDQFTNIIDELYGIYNFEKGKGAVEAFAIASKIREKKAANKGKATGRLGSVLESGLQTFQQAAYGGTATTLSMLGNLLSPNAEGEEYTVFDGFNDAIQNNIRTDFFQAAESSFTDEDGNVIWEAGNILENIGKSSFFTFEIMRAVRAGEMGSLSKGVGSLLNRTKIPGKIGTLTSQTKNNIIMADATWRMTIADNYEEAKALDLKGADAQIYAINKSVGTAVTQAIMPDNLLIKNNANVLFKNLAGSLKSASSRQATEQAIKQFSVNLGKEFIEEDLDYAWGEFVNFTYAVGEDKEISDYIRDQKEVAMGVIGLSGPLGGYGAFKTRQGLNDMLLNKFAVEGTESLLYLQTLAQEAAKSGNIELTEKLEKAFNYGQDLLSMAKMDPSAVTIEQLDLLIDRRDLQEQFKEADGTESDNISKKLDELDIKIAATADKVRADRVATDVQKAYSIARQTGAFDVVEGTDANKIADDLFKRRVVDKSGKRYTRKELRAAAKESIGLNLETEDGQQLIMVNTKVAEETGYTTTGQHEVLHAVLRQAIKNNPALAKAMGDALINELDNIQKGGGYIGEGYKARVRQYKESTQKSIYEIHEQASDLTLKARKKLESETDPMTQAEYDTYVEELAEEVKDLVAEQENIFNEELISLLSESLTRMEVTDILEAPKGLLSKVTGFVDNFALQAGIKGYDLTSGDNKLSVYNFVKQYNKEFAKGKLSRAGKRLLKTGTNIRFDKEPKGNIDNKVRKTAGIKKSLDTRQNVDWQDKGNGVYKTKKFMVSGSEYDIVLSDMTHMGGTTKDLGVQFFAYKPDSPYPTQELIGSSKNVIRAMAVIKNSIVDKALELDANSVMFTGKVEKNRTDVYEKIAKLSAQDLGWDFEVKEIAGMDESIESLEDLYEATSLSLSESDYKEIRVFKNPSLRGIKQSKMPDDQVIRLMEAKADLNNRKNKDMDLYAFTNKAYDKYVEYGKKDDWVLSYIAEAWQNYIYSGIKKGRFGKYSTWVDSVGDDKVRELATKVATGEGSQTVIGMIKAFKPGTAVVIDAEAGGENEGKVVSLQGYINKYLKNKVNWWFKKEEGLDEDTEEDNEVKELEAEIKQAKADGDFELAAILEEDLEIAKEAAKASSFKSFSTSSVDADSSFVQLTDEDSLEDFDFESTVTDADIVRSTSGFMSQFESDPEVQRLKFDKYQEEMQADIISGIDEFVSLLFEERGAYVTKEPFIKELKTFLKQKELKDRKFKERIVDRYKLDEFLSNYLGTMVNKFELPEFSKFGPMSRVKEKQLKETKAFVKPTKVGNKYVYLDPSTNEELPVRSPKWAREPGAAGKYITRRIKNAVNLPGFKAEVLEYFYPKGLDKKPDNKRAVALSAEISSEYALDYMYDQIQKEGTPIYNAMEDAMGRISLESEVEVDGKETKEDIARKARLNLAKQAIAKGLTEGVTNTVLAGIERKNFMQSKITGQVGKTGFNWFDNPRIAFTNYLIAAGPAKARALINGEIADRDFERLEEKLEDAHYDYLNKMGEADQWDAIQQKHKIVFEQKDFNDFDTFKNDLITQAELSLDSILDLPKGFAEFGKGATGKIKIAKKEGVLNYIDDQLTNPNVPIEARPAMFAGIIKQLLGATAAPAEQGMYLNTEGFFKEVVNPVVKKYGFNKTAFKLIDVVDGKSIAFKNEGETEHTKITSNLTKGVYSVDVFPALNDLSYGLDTVQNSIEVDQRQDEAAEAQTLFMVYVDWLRDKHATMDKVSVKLMLDSMFSKLRAIGPHMQPLTGAALVKDDTLLSDYTTVATYPSDFIKAAAANYILADKFNKNKSRENLENIIESGETILVPRVYGDVIRQLYPRTPRPGIMTPEVKNKLIQMGLPELSLTDLKSNSEIAVQDIGGKLLERVENNIIGAMRQSKLAPTKSINIVYAEDVLDRKAKVNADTMVIVKEDIEGVMEELIEEGIEINTNQVTLVSDEQTLAVALASQGYNDITGIKFSMKPGVNPLLQVANKNSKTNKANQQSLTGLKNRINKIIEAKTGIKANEKISKAFAANKRGSIIDNLFLHSDADDFQGLLYRMLPSAKKGGEADWAWMKEKLVDPYIAGVNALDNHNVAAGEKYKALKKKHKDVFKKLGDNLENTVLTYDQAIRYAVFYKDPANRDKLIEDVDPGNKGAAVRVLSEITRNTNLATLVDDLAAILNTNQQGGFTINLAENWFNQSIATEFMSLVSTKQRKAHLQTWSDNVDTVFDEGTLNKLQLAFGTSFRGNLENSIKRMKMGTKSAMAAGKTDKRTFDWLSAAVVPIMFLNSKSGVLQLLSLFNFINTSDNNVLKFMQAFANPKQYWKDFAFIFNSKKLKQRRAGLRMSIEEAEIANLPTGQSNLAWLRWLTHKIGFAPTKYADSLAIALGGATFYRNRINSLKGEVNPKTNKKYTVKEAEQKAFTDFAEISDQAQQSSDQMFISQEQAGLLGRVILAFANTPAQYARMMKKASMDLINGRGSRANNITKIIYYGAVQNAFFGLLQNWAFGAILGGDEEYVSQEEIEKLEEAIRKEDDKEKKAQLKVVLEGMQAEYNKRSKKEQYFYDGLINTLLRGMGYRGAAIAALKDATIELIRQKEKVDNKKGRYDNLKIASKLLSISPVVASKVADASKVYGAFTYDTDAIEYFGYSYKSPALYKAAVGVRFLTNQPMPEKIFRTLDHIRIMRNAETTATQNFLFAVGYSPTALDITDVERESIKEMAKFRRDLERTQKRKVEKMQKALREEIRKKNMTPEEKAKAAAEIKAKRKAAAKKAAATRKRNKQLKYDQLRGQ